MKRKMSYFLALFGVLFTFGYGCGINNPDSPTKKTLSTSEKPLLGATEAGELATMVVHFWNCGGGCRGSSTLISPNVVITNKHVVSWTGAPSIYIQQGTTPYVDADPNKVKQAFQVVEKVQHPTADLALLRLGCKVTSATPALINSTPLTNQHIGLKAKWVGYGPTTWTGTNYGTKRSNTSTISSISSGTFHPLNIYTAPGDSGGSVFGRVAQKVVVDDPGDTKGQKLAPSGGDDSSQESAKKTSEVSTKEDSLTAAKKVIAPLRRLIGVITWAGGGTTRVDPYASWINSYRSLWHSPSLQGQPQQRTINELSQPTYPATFPGIYQINNPQPGVTYTWSASNSATIVGPTTGIAVHVTVSSLFPFTLTVTATTASGCKTTFSQNFYPRFEDMH